MPYTSLPSKSRSSYLLMSKRALIGLAGLMALSIIVVSNYNSGEKGGRVVLSGNEQQKKKESVMLNPRYYGVDSKNRPFTISAARALQTDKDNITLFTITADMLLDKEKWLAISADEGMVIKKGDEIQLKKNVQMFFGEGYEFRSNYARILPDSGYASGNQPVEGQGPSGTLQADSFEVKDHGKHMIFRNNVKMMLYLE